MNPDELNKLIDDRVKVLIPDFLKTQGFNARKISDTPTDDFMVTPRKYVNAFGSIVSAPKASVVGIKFFATDLNYLIVKDSNYQWRNGAGSVVSLG